ncbi:uncharacterized protein LOC113005358 [Solenopsis invicta]|uniref:uncharacterized protein LOC113005358 n=1 Tax=Solenopsis invicta TaxID=13686 RepID=UPI00193E4E77|nr:uncharacterized protein LOC113005358 [Solenopsis invicta]
MGKRRAHRAYPGGRKRFFRKMIRDLNSTGEFDPSVFPPPRLSPLPSPREVDEALSCDVSPIQETAGTLEDYSLGSPRTANVVVSGKVPARDDRADGRPRARTAKISPDPAPIRVPTRPLPLRATTLKPGTPSLARRGPRIIGDIMVPFKVKRTPSGYLISHVTRT